MTKEQKAVVEEIGFGKLLSMSLDGLATKIGHYVVANFCEKTMVIKLEDDKNIQITKDLVYDMLGIRKGKVNLLSLEKQKKMDKETRKWRSKHALKVYPNDCLNRITENKETGWAFKLDFLTLVLSMLGDCDKSGRCRLDFLRWVNNKMDLKDIEWCEYVLNNLKKSKKFWKPQKKSVYYSGPLVLLLLAYLDGTKCKKYDVERRRPAILGWTTEKMKRREDIESMKGGFGLGEMEKKFSKKKEKLSSLEDNKKRLKNLHEWMSKEKQQFENLWLQTFEDNEGNEELQTLREKHDRLFSGSWVVIAETQEEKKKEVKTKKKAPVESEEDLESEESESENDSDGEEDESDDDDDDNDNNGGKNNENDDDGKENKNDGKDGDEDVDEDEVDEDVADDEEKVDGDEDGDEDVDGDEDGDEDADGDEADEEEDTDDGEDYDEEHGDDGEHVADEDNNKKDDDKDDEAKKGEKVDEKTAAEEPRWKKVVNKITLMSWFQKLFLTLLSQKLSM